MNASDRQKPEPGADVRRAEPRMGDRVRRELRRKSICAIIFGMFMGAGLLGGGLWEVHTGEVLRHISRGVRLNGWELCALGVVVMAMCAWALWRILTNRQ
jgi:hypothetical protein